MSKRRPKAFRKLRRFELAVVAVCLLVLALLGPLRAFTVGLPPVAFAGAFVLLAAPGALLARWLARDLFPGPALVPAAVALGVGIYGLVGAAALLLHLSLNLYLIICGCILALFLGAAVVVAFRPERTAEAGPGPSGSGLWLWPPFVVLGGSLVFLSGTSLPWIDGDTWNYLAWVRDYLDSDRLAAYNPYFGTETGVSRILINGFFLEQAALSWLSGIDPVTLALQYLSPTLTAVSLLAFYALGRRLFGPGPALAAGCLYALFLIVNLDGTLPLFGKEYLVRIIQDKGVARFIFMPVALCFAVGYLERRKFGHLFLFGLLCWAVITVHPAGLAIIGLSAAGYGLLHVLVGWRRWPAWTGAISLGAALLSILVVPAAYVLVTGRAFSSALYSADIGDSDPVVLANQVFVREEWLNILVLDGGSYIMHPSLLLNPFIAAAYLLGVPFLLWRLWRGPNGGTVGRTAPQLLFGMLLVATVASYVPLVATFLGDKVVAPGQLHRLSWPIPLAAFLTLGWMLWAGVRWISGNLRLPARVVPPVVLVAICCLAAAIGPSGVVEVARTYGYNNPDASVTDNRLDPTFRWMERNITEPSVVLAPDVENIAIPAYSSDANVVSFRGAPVMDNLEDLERVSGQEIEVPRGSLDMRAFYSTATPEQRREILRRYEIDYVVLPLGNPLLSELEAMPGLDRIGTSSEKYALFAVDRGSIDG